jgi:hypothetical protein
LLVLYINCSHPRCICSPNHCLMCEYFNDIVPKYNSKDIWLYSGYGGKWWVNDPKNNEVINKIYAHDIKRKEKASDDDSDDFSIEVKKTGKRQLKRTINNSSIDITSFKPVVINNKTSFVFKSVNTDTDNGNGTDTEDSDEIIVSGNHTTDNGNNDAIEYIISVNGRSYVIDFINMQQYDITHPERKRNIKKITIKDDDILTSLKQDNSIRGVNGIPFSK